MDKKTKNFFWRSVISIILVCILVFLWLTFFMTSKTNEAIQEISNTYMSEMNMQIEQKFSSIIDLQLQQVEGIIQRTMPDEVEYGDEMLEELTLSAEIRNFIYLGLYGEDGTVETIYGHIPTTFHDDVMEFMDTRGNLVMNTVNSNGEKILMLGKVAAYPMKNGGKSRILLVGLPMDYLSDVLFLTTDEAKVYYHIIDKKGNFVIRGTDVFRENYFDRIRAEFDVFEGKTPEDYAMELQQAMELNEPYVATVSIGGAERHIYCSPLSENNTWYLISVMPNNILTDSLSHLDIIRTASMFISLAIIFVALSVIFFMYYRLSQRQLEELNRARESAVNANNAKSEFLSSMSHDIRTPMNAIIGMTEIALKNLKDPTRVEECLKKVRLSSKHLLGLINDVLDMSKIESGKMTLTIAPMSLRDAMDDIVNIIRPQVEEKTQYFDIFIDKIMSENVCGDSVRLNQVLINLLSNAVKFTPEGGHVSVQMHQEESPKGGDYVRTHFFVVDTGIGMTPEFQKKIWDNFAREETETVHHIQGTGLGTSIVKKIIDLMGGTIELQSRQGQGSTFHVILDLKKSDISDEQMQLPKWNVLVVDDNKQLCESAVANLEELGVHAEWTLDGREAIQMIDERHSRQDDYHFVLIDWKMPGMDGMETITQIRNRVGTDMPIFLISAYDWSKIEDEAKNLPVEGFIGKPLFKSTLYERLKQYMEGVDTQDDQSSNKEIDFNGKHILLSEDMDINWEIAYEILSAAGLVLDRAVNGKVCVEMFERSEVGYYDAILMDIRMPVMNGYDATRAIRALDRPDKDLPIIAMTADAFSDDAQRCMECGMNAHIPKPLDIKECMRILQNFCGE